MPYQKDIWQIFIQGHAVRVEPLNFSQDASQHRNAYAARLSGFNPLVLAADFIPIMQDCNIKAIVIPRRDHESYVQRPWAYMFF